MRGWLVGPGVFAALLVAVAACSEGSTVDEASLVPDAATELDTGSLVVPVEAGSSDAGADTGPKDTVPPGAVADLAGTALTQSSVELTWTAPGGDGAIGTAAFYEIRYATTPITSLAEFAAGTSVTAPLPQASGTAQKVTATGLTGGTLYYFALRAQDSGGNYGPLSNIAEVTTKARAAILVSEIATSNAGSDGPDFVELVVTTGGWAQDIEIRQQSGSLYKLGAVELQTGDRIVIHASGGVPANGVQEDVSKSKTASTSTYATTAAYDVYSAATSITATDNLISVLDGTKSLDAVAISNRDGDAAAASMTAFATAKASSTWTFSVAPADGTNDCQIQRETASISTITTSCGGFPTGVASGVSLQRYGVIDTNSKADFYVAPQTRGVGNAAVPAPTVTNAVATSATQVVLSFSQEIAPANAAAFTIAGLNVSAATVTENVVTLTTATQGGGVYNVGMDATVKNLQSVPVSPATARFCGFSASAATLALSEVSPDLPGGADLVELRVLTGGNLAGFTLRTNPSAGSPSGTSLLATLPAICAADGDVVVVHLAPPAGTAATSETQSKTEHPAATYAANYDAAWDVLGGANGIGYTSTASTVLALRAPSNTYVDVAPFASPSATAASAAFTDSLVYFQGLGLWLPADCGGVACVASTARSVSIDWTGCGSTPNGASVYRTTSGTSAGAWTVGASSFGTAAPF